MIFKKYLIIAGSPVVFDSNLIHADIAGDNKKYVEAAGFVYLEYLSNRLDVTCMGESSSLNIASRGEIDASLIAKLLN